MSLQSVERVPKGRRRHRPQVLVLESDPEVRSDYQRIVANKFNVTLLNKPDEFVLCLGESPTPDLVLVDWFAGEECSGKMAMNLLTWAVKSRPSLPVIVVFPSPVNLGLKNMIVLAKRMGAADILLKPFTEREIGQVFLQFLTNQDAAALSVDETPLDENTSFVRCCKQMREIESQCALVAPTDLPVLILGESGTGKEIVAKFIHKMSARSRYDFLKVNCAAMPLDLLESELFGYEQGAFTGAVKSKPGKFEMCNHGTIFLDEIGEMPGALQAKLLHVLQDGSFSRLGGRVDIRVDVRVIAATNIDIKSAIAQKHFREDLYYRLNGFGVCIPPLRERLDEIPTLADYFMRKHCSRYRRDPLPISALMMQALSNYPWPGNLRELETTIKRYLVFQNERVIINELVPIESAEATSVATESLSSRGGLKRLVRGVKGNTESAVIAQALDEMGWNRKAAACQLQISYKALLYKIKQYNVGPCNESVGAVSK
jgi:DNA-binding NtrC family response regulator